MSEWIRKILASRGVDLSMRGRSHVLALAFVALPILALLCASPLPAADETPAAVLAAVDATRNAFEEAVITARATQLADGVAQPGAADFDIYVKGGDRGLIVFRNGKNSGRKVLTSGDKMWLLVPGASRPLPVTPNQRLVGGASMGDVARLRFADDFTATARPGTEVVAGRTCRVFDLQAKATRSAYPRVTLWYDAAARLPARVLFFLPSGKEAKEISFEKFASSHGKTIVSSMLLRDLLASDSKTATRLEYLDYKPAKLPDSIFTPEGALSFS
jgi:hypothetical protein